MKILIVEPFFSGSHKKWACGYQQYSQHNVEILSLPGRHWKWRMYGGAVSLANTFKKNNYQPDLILASDMLDLSTFVSLLRKEINNIPVALYFHENQITYPWSPTDQDVSLRRDNHYGFINYTSALAADYIFYNSQYHLDSFLRSLPRFLNQFPDYRELQNIDAIRKKSALLYLGVDLKIFDAFRVKKENELPVLLWNHRWEYDKNPEAFYKALCFLKAENLDFKLIVLGENYQQSPTVFEKINTIFKQELLHFGYVKGFEAYADWLWRADISPVTSNQDFFGGSVVEAIYCQNHPILPSRLAYPEHISNDLKEKYFYADEADFHQKLKQAVLYFKDKTNKEQLPNFVARYDWSNLAPLYDLTFQNILDEYHQFRK
ncbi:MAG: glycosyltransferase involved in cell wall biosynthesis [Saprospiraceae bacterium]|jgi:glycosyltransferase involved in cell wall biosynthesis